MIHVHLLGAFQVLDGEGTAVDLPVGKPAAVLAYLLLEPHATSREELARMFWPGATRERGLQSVRQALWTLRRALGDALFTEPEGLKIDRATVSCDVLALREALADDDVGTAGTLWRGPLLERFYLPGVPLWEQWVEEQRTALESAFSDALRRSAAAARRAGEVQQACALMERAIEVQPWSSSARLAWIDLLIDLGQHRAAAGALAAARRDFPEEEFQPDLLQRESRLVQSQEEDQDPLVRAELVGRIHELGILAGLWLSARQGRSMRAVVAGAPGIGKSRLTGELLRIAERDGARVVRVAAAEADQELEWAGVASMARQLLQLPGAAGASAASETILRRLVPSLAGGAHRAEGPIPEGGVISDALGDLITAIAWEAPLLLVVDDARWLDAKSWAVIRRVALHTVREPVLWVFALRTDPADPHGAASLLRVTRALGEHTFVRLPPFTLEETTQFLVTNGGLSGDVAARITDSVHELTRGVPLFTAEVVRYLRQVGRIAQRGRAWHWVGPETPLELPATMPQLFESRLRGLPEAAERVLAELARGRFADAELQKVSGLDAASLDHVLDALQQAGLLRTEEEGHRVAHDALGRLLRERASDGAARSRSRRRRRVAMMVVGFGTLLAVAVAWTAAPPRYGGGSLIVAVGDEYVAYSPARWPSRAWRAHSMGPLADGATRLLPPERTSLGDVVQLAEAREADASPHAAERTPEGFRTLLRLRTDVVPQSVSPDGRYVMLMRDDPGTDSVYDVGVVLHDRGSSEQRLVYQGRFGLNYGVSRWSHDGMLFDVVTQAGRDTLLVLKNDGGIVHRVTADAIVDATWCGPRRLVARVRERAAPMLLISDLAVGDTLIADPALGQSLGVACSPDGETLAYVGINDGVARPILLHLPSATVEVLPLPRDARVIRWEPDRLPPVPAAVEHAASRVLVVGGRTTPTPRVVDRTGRSLEIPVALSSSDPRVLSVNAEGEAVANRVGAATLYFSVNGVPLDSLRVDVQPPVPAALVLDERFTTLDAWHVIGEGYDPADPRRRGPPVRLAAEGGAGVLAILGDHNYADGIATRNALRTSAGVQVEVEYAFALSHFDKQQLQVGLWPDEPSRDEHGITWLANPPLVHFAYPATTGAKFSRTEASTASFGANQYLAVPEAAGDGTWHTLRLVVRPDGHAEYWLDGALLLESAARAQALDVPLRVAVLGSSVGTRLDVRRVRIWEGVPE